MVCFVTKVRPVFSLLERAAFEMLLARTTNATSKMWMESTRRDSDCKCCKALGAVEELDQKVYEKNFQTLEDNLFLLAVAVGVRGWVGFILEDRTWTVVL